jgi:uncharacterized protein (TIGR02646 family)
LRAALRPLAHGKCAYCESTLGVTTDLEIEHYVAKSRELDLAFEWTNLLPACRMCNSAKGDTDHRNTVLKPDDEDPEPYFWVEAATGRLEPHPALDESQKQRAEETIRIHNLQRGALCSNRFRRIQQVRRWLERASQVRRLSIRLREEWEELAHPAAEYKLVLRWFFEQHGASALAREDRRRFEAPPGSQKETSFRLMWMSSGRRPVHTRPRGRWSCAKPNSSACSITITDASGPGPEDRPPAAGVLRAHATITSQMKHLPFAFLADLARDRVFPAS